MKNSDPVFWYLIRSRSNLGIFVHIHSDNYCMLHPMHANASRGYALCPQAGHRYRKQGNEMQRLTSTVSFDPDHVRAHTRGRRRDAAAIVQSRVSRESISPAKASPAMTTGKEIELTRHQTSCMMLSRTSDLGEKNDQRVRSEVWSVGFLEPAFGNKPHGHLYPGRYRSSSTCP